MSAATLLPNVPHIFFLITRQVLMTSLTLMDASAAHANLRMPRDLFENLYGSGGARLVAEDEDTSIFGGRNGGGSSDLVDGTGGSLRARSALSSSASSALHVRTLRGGAEDCKGKEEEKTGKASSSSSSSTKGKNSLLGSFQGSLNSVSEVAAPGLERELEEKYKAPFLARLTVIGFAFFVIVDSMRHFCVTYALEANVIVASVKVGDLTVKMDNRQTTYVCFNHTPVWRRARTRVPCSKRLSLV